MFGEPLASSTLISEQHVRRRLFDDKTNVQDLAARAAAGSLREYTFRMTSRGVVDVNESDDDDGQGFTFQSLADLVDNDRVSLTLQIH